jgi:phospholipase C
VANLLQFIRANETVYSKTAFVLTWDEGGQFFDHHWPPTPPTNDRDGKSNIPV